MKLFLKMKYFYISNMYFLIFGCVYCVQTDRVFKSFDCYTNCSEQQINENLYISTVPCLEKCGYDLIKMGQDIKNSESNGTLSAPQMHCCSEDELTVKWKPWHESFLYLLETRGNSTKWIVIGTTFNNYFTISNLSANHEYQIRLWGAGTDNMVWGPKLSPWLRTLDANSDPLNITNITLHSLQVDDTGLFVAAVEWIPNQEEPACFYDIVLFHRSGAGNYREREIKKPPEQFEVVFDKLQFDSNYSLKLMAKSKDWERESSEIELHITTPTCLEKYDDLNICPPPSPTNLSALETLVNVVKTKNSYITYYSISTFWDKPKLTPDYYELFLTNYNYTRINMTVPGNATEAVFNYAEISWAYQVVLIAYSAAGSSVPATIQRNIVITQLVTSSKHLWIMTIVGTIILSILTLIGVGFSIYHRRAKRERYDQRCKYFEELEEKAPKSIECITNNVELVLENSNKEVDKWDLCPDMLLLQNVLGEGAFGLVRRAWLRDEKGNASLEVAVKMLKYTPSSEQVKHFLHEIDIMKTVGSHPNLVSILGSCTRPQPGGNMMLVVEYCALGDLQNYLRSVWNRMTSEPTQNIQYADIVSPINSETSGNLIINKLYDLANETKANVSLQPSDLLSFARQIATGMEFLTNLKVLHRDLAARNVLVCADKTVKIADFGLSRDVYKDNMYRKTSNGKLPIRWMAIESLTHQIYTAQSDVWSFGILLWEIVTLGGNPYPGVPTNALLKLLRSGYRMERPSNCGLELYTIMLSCWKVRPKDRPTFSELRKLLDALLESVTTAKYLDLDVLTSMQFASFRMPINDSTPVFLKTKRNGDSVPSERYVHPILINS